MAFKIFRKDSPATPKNPGGLARFARKIQLTPTALDGSLRGEQKRTEILESQLRDVSTTAANAYDEIDELRMRNDMLNEQVVQQKSLIDSLMNQVDESNAEKKQLKLFHEDQLKNNLKDHSHDGKILEEIKKEKNQMGMELTRLKAELKGYKNLYEQELSRNLNSEKEEAEEEKNISDDIFSKPETDFSSISVPNYIDNIKINDINENQEQKQITITGLMKRVRQLELQLEANTNEYETSLSNMRNTIMIIRDSKEFLEHGKSFRIMDAAGVTYSDHYNSHKAVDLDESFDDEKDEKDNKDGETFVLSNISFLK